MRAAPGSDCRSTPETCRKLMLHLARGQEEQALTSLSLMCQLAKDLRAEEDILTQVLKQAFFYKTPHGMDDELSKRFQEAVKEANVAEGSAEWESLLNTPFPAPPSAAVDNGAAALDENIPLPEGTTTAWDRRMVPDSKSIGWPGVRKPGFIDACEHMLSNLFDRGHDALGTDQLADDMKAYESGITLGHDLETHKATLRDWHVPGAEGAASPATTFVAGFKELTPEMRRDLYAGTSTCTSRTTHAARRALTRSHLRWLTCSAPCCVVRALWRVCASPTATGRHALPPIPTCPMPSSCVGCGVAVCGCASARASLCRVSGSAGIATAVWGLVAAARTRSPRRPALLSIGTRTRPRVASTGTC